MTTPYRESSDNAEAKSLCSFCGKSTAEVKKLVAGPANVAICDECIGLCNDIIGEEAKKQELAKAPGPPDRSEIAKVLEANVVGCGEAKRVLTAALLQHALQASPSPSLSPSPSASPSASPPPTRARRILLVGPSGSGKSALGHAACTLARPSVGHSTSVGRMSESGYIGEDAEHALRGLLAKAGADAEIAPRGVLFLDDIDKLEAAGRGRDISGGNVQRELLRILEGMTIELSGVRAPLVKIDTSGVLVIGAVRVEGIDPTNLRKGLAERGLLDPFLARFDTIVWVPPLAAADAKLALTRHDGMLARANRLLATVDSRLDLTADAVDALATAAAMGGGGWRLRSALESMVEEILVVDRPPPLVRRDASSLHDILERS